MLCQWTSYTFLKSGDHQKIKHINFKIPAVKKFINFTLNFEILDFENFLFCEKVPQTWHTDAWKVSWNIDNFWLRYHENSTKIPKSRDLPCYWLYLSQKLTQVHQTFKVLVLHDCGTFSQKWKFSKSKISKFRVKFINFLTARILKFTYLESSWSPDFKNVLHVHGHLNLN